MAEFQPPIWRPPEPGKIGNSTCSNTRKMVTLLWYHGRERHQIVRGCAVRECGEDR
jgi:hypothetical protein